MKATQLVATLFFLACQLSGQSNSLKGASSSTHARRLVILKVDGLGADLLYQTMQQQDSSSGKSKLPWLSHIFAENGVIMRNFYVRGISLSAPSWSMLDTGQHSVIRGNVEYDRYTGRVYDYLNFFPFYLGYARNKAVDMPGVEVLDRAGIPLLIDRFPYQEQYQGFQLFQRGVRWITLESALKRQFSGKALLGMIESGGMASLDTSLAAQSEAELESGLENPEILYLDLFTGDIDHQGHATSDPAAMFHELEKLDSLAGRIWTHIQRSALAQDTLFAVVSDHGMNSVPGIVSQTFNLADLLNSPQGGAHHVVTDREQLSDFKVRGINPLVHRVITPSTESFYLSDQENKYPTAWLDIDGNERAALYLRYSDLNKIHILLEQLALEHLPPAVRLAAATAIRDTIERHRNQWSSEAAELERQMVVLKQVTKEERGDQKAARQPNDEDRENGGDKAHRRKRIELEDQEHDLAAYASYAAHLRKILRFDPEGIHVFRSNIDELVPAMSLGDNNSVGDLQHYIVGPAAAGLVVDAQGRLDEANSFRYVNYFDLLARQRVRNSAQPALGSKPIDFVALRLTTMPRAAQLNQAANVYWLYGDEQRQLLILVDDLGQLSLKPVVGLSQTRSDDIRWTAGTWQAGLPLALYEDPNLHVPAGEDRAQWLGSWHSERAWLNAIHECKYSNGVISVTEQLSPVERNVPGKPGIATELLALERKRRELVRPDLQIFALDHWNFNVRFPNPGGNHGSFLRISTHSVWMMAGSGVPAASIETPYDSLSFASTLLDLLGRRAPRPDRVIALTPDQP